MVGHKDALWPTHNRTVTFSLGPGLPKEEKFSWGQEVQSPYGLIDKACLSIMTLWDFKFDLEHQLIGPVKLMFGLPSVRAKCETLSTWPQPTVVFTQWSEEGNRGGRKMQKRFDNQLLHSDKERSRKRKINGEGNQGRRDRDGEPVPELLWTCWGHRDSH